MQLIPSMSVQNPYIKQVKSPTLNTPYDILTPIVTLYEIIILCELGTFSPEMLADIYKQFCKTSVNTEITLYAHHDKMHMVTFNPMTMFGASHLDNRAK